jgi:hypothetical protein
MRFEDEEFINPLGKQETSCASKAKSDRSKSGLNDEDHSREARPRRKIDLTQPQQADRLLFAQRVNKIEKEAAPKTIRGIICTLKPEAKLHLLSIMATLS